MLEKINASDRLYVQTCGGGYSCVGFDVAERLTIVIADWLRRPELRPRPEDKGTIAGWQSYEKALEAGRVHNRDSGEKCFAELIPEFTGHEGRVVEVVDCYGNHRMFTIARSTGWMPCHLEVDGRGEGGPAVTGYPFKEVKFLTTSRR